LLKASTRKKARNPPREPQPSPPAAQAAREAPKGKPFKFKASGAEHTFQGVEELEDGSLRVSKEATPQFRGVLASYVELQRTSKEERRDLQRQLNAAQTRKSDKDHEADAITKLFKDIQAMSPEERWAWAENFTDNAEEPRAGDQAAGDRPEGKGTRGQQNGQQDLLPEEAEEQLQNTLQQEVYSTFTRLLALPEAKHSRRGPEGPLREMAEASAKTGRPSNAGHARDRCEERPALLR
jgi:hypothetical protein